MKGKTEKPDIKIDEEFKSIIPPLQQGEFAALKKSIEEEGFRDPFVVWKDKNILLDGYHRWQIGEAAGWPKGYEISIYEKDFKNREQAKIWIIDNQLGRRNLPDICKAELQFAKKAILAEKGRKKQAHGETAPGKTLLSKNDKSVSEPKHDTQDQIANELGWSTGKTAQAEIVLKETEKDPKLKKKLINGLCYYRRNKDYILMLPGDLLRKTISQNISTWKKRYGERPAQNEGYKTWNVAVPDKILFNAIDNIQGTISCPSCQTLIVWSELFYSESVNKEYCRHCGPEYLKCQAE